MYIGCMHMGHCAWLKVKNTHLPNLYPLYNFNKERERGERGGGRKVEEEEEERSL